MRNPKTRKLDFRHYIQRPTGRLQRYTLFLEQIIKHTPNDNPDKDSLDNALQVIKELCRESDNNVFNTERRLKLEEINRRLKKRNGEPIVRIYFHNITSSRMRILIFYYIISMNLISMMMQDN